MRFGRNGFALLSFCVVAGALANPLTARADGSQGSHGSEGFSGGDQRATFVLRVPHDAKVFFQDEPTSTTGTRRHYRTPALKAGKSFVFAIRVEVRRNGRLVSNTQKPRLQAGSRVEFAFALTDADRNLLATRRDPRPSATPPRTIRHVPTSIRRSST